MEFAKVGKNLEMLEDVSGEAQWFFEWFCGWFRKQEKVGLGETVDGGVGEVDCGVHRE